MSSARGQTNTHTLTQTLTHTHTRAEWGEAARRITRGCHAWDYAIGPKSALADAPPVAAVICVEGANNHIGPGVITPSIV